MRRAAATTSRARRSSGVPVALFPFLAVLMCAMGALALLLVAVSRNSRLQASTARGAAATSASSSTVQEVQVERENVQWRISELQSSRRQTEAQLAEARLKLGHLEDHAGRLRAQIAQLQASLAEMERLGGDQRRQEAAAELERIKGRLAQAERQLDEARRAAQGRQPSYAVIPYDGPNQTRRRPIYLECCADALILQPEGIVFTADDFVGPLGPGNPLDVALRAMREHLLKARASAGEAQEPYPLLLVRPDGIEAYYAARAAMASWGTEFGYELIGEDWKLRFPKRDVPLARTIQELVASARVRQKQLAAAAPSTYGPPQSSTRYRAAPFRGGVMRDSGPGDGDGAGAYASRPAFGRTGRSFGSGGFGSASSSGGAGEAMAGGAMGAAAAPGSAGAAAGSPLGSEAAMNNGQASQNLAARPEGFVMGRPPREEEPLQEVPASQRVATVVRPGEWIEKPPPRPPEKPQDKQKDPKNRPNVRSLAESRGRDWGLPDATRGSIGITRAIRVDCHQDRLVVAPDAGAGRAKTIPLGDRTAASVDALISTVWEHMDSWGIAGKGMYWRPVLNVHVAPNGEARFDELKVLLDGSGLDVHKYEG